MYPVKLILRKPKRKEENGFTNQHTQKHWKFTPVADGS